MSTPPPHPPPHPPSSPHSPQSPSSASLTDTGRAGDTDPGTLALVVVGASLEAERDDRPVAGMLCDGLNRMLGAGIKAMACTDLWFLNHEELRSRPVVSVGPPWRNAVTATMVESTPTLYVVDGSLAVQGDPAMLHARVCCWGVDAGATRDAAEVFLSRHAEAFARRASDGFSGS